MTDLVRKNASATTGGELTTGTQTLSGDKTITGQTTFNQDPVNANGPIGMPSGALLPFAGASAPTGYMLCDGSAISRTTYADLFAAIGTTWGVGDGSTTFNIPNLLGRTLKGAGAATDGNGGDTVALGAFQDDATAVNGLGTQTDGAHNHNEVYRTGQNGSGGGDAFIRYPGSNNATYNIGSNNSGHNHTLTGDTETRPKAYGVNYIIKV